MESNDKLIQFVLQWADNSMIIGQRLSEWCGHGPVLEQDIALINIALDLIGEAKYLYEYVGELTDKTADEVAFLRYEHEYRNALLVELPNGHWGKTIIRQFLFDSWHRNFLQAMTNSTDERLVSIAEKCLKESKYHLKFSSEWTKRLGDGTDESRSRMQEALDDVLPYYHELFNMSDFDQWAVDMGIYHEPRTVEREALNIFDNVINLATLKPEENVVSHDGGKEGRHTEAMGYILTEMQYMQRAYPDMVW